MQKEYLLLTLYKVSATHMKGYNIIGKLVIVGQKAKKERGNYSTGNFEKTSKILEEKKYKPFTETKYDLIGTNSIYGSDNINSDSKELFEDYG